MTKKRGFSIIELSITIVIIAILVGAVLTINQMSSNATLSAAKTITKTSPVADMEDLILWFETTMPQSFDESEVDQSQTISNWYDLSSNRIDAAQSTETNKPSYLEDGINGLPVISFDGTDNYMTFDGTYLSNTNYTIFIIEQRTNSKSDNAIIGNDQTGDPKLLFSYASSTGLRHSHGSGYGTYDYTVGSYRSPVPRILGFTFDSSTGKMYINGTNVASNSLSSQESVSMAIGKYDSNYYQGEIGEIIAFGRVLSDEERKDVEQYLSKKWNIELD